MADCSATGTALDRAARFVAAATTTSGGVAASKQVVSNLLSHAAIGSHHGVTATTSSSSTPQVLIMPGNDSFLYPSSTVPLMVSSPSPPLLDPSVTSHIFPPTTATNMMDSLWNQQRQQQQLIYGPQQRLLVPPQHHMPSPHHLRQHQQPQHPFMFQAPPMMNHHHLGLMQQQEHQRNMMMMLQQQQQQQQQHNMAVMHMLEVSRQKQQQSQAELTKTLERDELIESKEHLVAEESSTPVMTTTLNDVADKWHEGLEDEVSAVLEGDNNLGHEGIVSGATIDELTAAWAQAEADYDREMANLWVGDTQSSIDEAPLSYEFHNRDVPPPPQEQLKDRDWLGEGMEQFREGNIKQAIYLFEMELQHGNPDNATAWKMLGRCHAENDQDRQAIACLEQAIDRDPYSTESLLALGVSYVNELDHDRALLTLKAWITHNPKFAGLDLSEDDMYGAAAAATSAETATRERAFEEVQRLLLRALEYDPTDAADVHEALGVVYNVSRDYVAAVASFRKAIESRPEDYQLWNKLGATLANSNQSDKALPAYYHALQLKPKYARAWLNMAISHSNLQNYEEAARCYLQTISLNPSAVHCWSYLRIALSCSERWDLIPFAASQDIKAFRDHYDFILYESE